jgi:IS5 family transposase
MSKIKQHKFKKFSKISKNICERLRMPLYNSRFSNKIFTNHQKIFLLVYKAEKRLTYRQLEEDLHDSKIPEYIGLKRIPRWTTLQNFASNSQGFIIEKMIKTSANLVEEIGLIAGIDSTGFSLDTASHHYCKRINRKRPIKAFVTFQALSDLDNQVVRSVRLHRKRMHDSRHLIPLWNKGSSSKILAFVADKGYDSEKNMSYLAEKGVAPLISMKNMEIPKHKTKGTTRKYMKSCFDYGIYFNRAKCETIFSSIKRKYGSILKSRTLRTQKMEILTKVLAYNINQVIDFMLKIILSIGFGQSLFLH